jgi:hypothetical protein
VEQAEGGGDDKIGLSPEVGENYIQYHERPVKKQAIPIG